MPVKVFLSLHKAQKRRQLVAQEKSSMMLLICLKNSKSEFGRDLNLKMQKKLLQTLFAKERDGRILLDINNGI